MAQQTPTGGAPTPDARAATTSPSRRGPAAAGAPPSPRSNREHPHASHVREYLERMEEGITSLADPGDVYLGHEQGEQFWELLGLRLKGHPATVLGAVRFNRHDLPGVSHARESVGAYLNAPPTPPTADRHAPPPGHVALLLPRFHRPVPAFLRALREGQVPVPVHLSPDSVELAFDFRSHNPSGLESVKRRAGPLRPHFLRTTAGHVIRGRCMGLGGGHASRFVAVTEAEQLTPKGALRLPTLILNRAFVALAVEVEDEETRLAAPNWLSFLPAAGVSRHLLLG